MSIFLLPLHPSEHRIVSIDDNVCLKWFEHPIIRVGVDTQLNDNYVAMQDLIKSALQHIITLNVLWVVIEPCTFLVLRESGLRNPAHDYITQQRVSHAHCSKSNKL